jgi:Leucine-rich repeat (LRR) protein
MTFLKRHLWWLLVPVMAGLLLAGFQFSLFYRQQAAIQQIEKLGGRVVTTHGEPRWIQWLIGGKSLRIFEQATVVNLSQNKVEDADLIHLRNLNGLQRLNLNETRITDDGLRHLEWLTGLKALDLSGTQISGKGLEYLHGLTALEYLYLSQTKVGNADLRHLKGLTSLRHLDVAGTAVSDEGVDEIKRHLHDVEVEW